MNKFLVQITIATTMVAGMVHVAFAQQGSILDHTEHPTSPEYTGIYPDEMNSLDSSLSWLDRFNGDETFNAAETLVESGSMAMMDHTSAETQMMNMGSGGMGDMKMDAMGIVKGIKHQSGKVKISHGPIDKFGMPEMTMVFKVEDPEMLSGLETDNEVGFNVDNSSGGFVITQIMPVMAMMPEKLSSGMDARGTVKVIRADQGKVKISHGPIDKYGMPEMSMMFKVKDPAMLHHLEKDIEVDFNVDNSSGGFVITEIKPVSPRGNDNE